MALGTPTLLGQQNGSSDPVSVSITTSGASYLKCAVLSNGTVSDVSTPTDGSWFKEAESAADPSSNIQYWSLQSSGALSESVTINLSSADYTTAHIIEQTGVDTTTAHAPGTGTATATSGAVIIETTVSDSTIYGGARMGSVASPGANTSLGFSVLGGSNYLLTQYDTVSSAQTSPNHSVDDNDGDNNGIIGWATQPAAAGGGFVPYPNPRYSLAGGMQPMGGGNS